MKIVSKIVRDKTIMEMEYKAKDHVAQVEFGAYNVWFWLSSRARHLHRTVENCLLYVMEKGTAV